MTDMNEVTQLRLQLLANGFSPIQNHDKRTFLRGWPKLVVTEEVIRSWARQRRDAATGIRVENGLAVIDLDINDAKAINLIADRIFDAVPELGDPNAPLLVRHGSGAKEAWFVRTDEAFGRIHSRAWLKPGEGVDDGAHRVEIFGGGSPRQFGAFGPHTVADDGRVEIEYRWVDRSPADTRQSELPVLTKKQFFAIMDIVEATLRELGWQLVERSTAGENDVTRIYDLDDTMSFDIDTGEHLSLPDLRARAAALGRDGDTLRCSASWLEGPSAKRRDRCIVSLTRAGHLAVWETASGVTHIEAAGKPREYEIDHDRVAERLRELADRRLNKVKSADTAVVAAGKLLATYAFCPYQRDGIVPIWASSIDAGMNMMAFRTLHLPNCDEEQGPRGGTVRINPVDIWAADERRMNVAGLRMRPDQPRPTFEDRGELWVNTYSPPSHEAEGGDPDPGLDFMTQIAPEPAERAYLMQWLAHKYRYPHVPGPALVLVAQGRYGTGRGMLAELLRRLFGVGYIREMPYAMIAGRTYQSQYTDWAADKLIIFVSESAETESGTSRYDAKVSTYEHLKTLVEPNMVERTFVSKTRSAFTAMACASYVIATNHQDALPIPEGDRRFAVLMSGDTRDATYWEQLRAWMDDAANVAAFAAELRAVDLAGYNPYVAPPMTQTKRLMIDSGKSDLDRAFELVVESFNSDVMVLDQVVAGIRMAQSQYGFELPDRWSSIARKVATQRLFRVGVFESTNWQIRVDVKKYAVYARSKQAAAHWKTRDGLREEVLKNGAPSATGLPGNVLQGLFRPPVS